MYSSIIKEYTDKLENKQTIEKVISESDRIEAIDFANSIAKVADIPGITDLSFNINLKGGEVYLLCKYLNKANKGCKGGFKVNETMDIELNKLLTLISKGEKALEVLNNKLDELRVESGILTSLSYRWGMGKKDSIAYWDYTNLVIRLSDESLNKLIELADSETFEDDLGKQIHDFKWSDNIIEVIKEYNTLTISGILSSRIDNSSIENILTTNMLSYDDVHNLIMKSDKQSGSQKLKSVQIISELGLFAAIVLWNIDYETHKISVDILDEKVIDIENSRFVSDYSLYSRIEQKIINQADSIASEFSTNTRI